MSELAVALCVASGGIARTAVLRAAGATAADLAEAVQRQTLVQPRRGIYAVPPLDPAVRDALAHRGKVGCVTAARRHGLWTLDDGPDEVPHVWIDPERHSVAVDGCRCAMHREHRMPGGDLARVGVAQCLVEIAWCRGAEAFLCALESALRQGLLADTDRQALVERVPASMRELVDFARSDADSGLETLVRYRLHLLGITCRTQVPVPGVGRVDLVIGDRLIIETDGKTHDGDQRHRDLVRDAVALSHGFVTIRLDSALVLHDWDTAVAAILSAIERGWHESALGRRIRSVGR